MRLDELADRVLEANRHTLLANTRRAYHADHLRFARSFPTRDTADLAAKQRRAFLAAADRAPATLAPARRTSPALAALTRPQRGAVGAADGDAGATVAPRADATKRDPFRMPSASRRRANSTPCG